MFLSIKKLDVQYTHYIPSTWMLQKASHIVKVNILHQPFSDNNHIIIKCNRIRGLKSYGTLCCAAGWVDPNVPNALGSLRTSGTTNPTTEQNTPDDLDLLLFFCGNMYCKPHSEVTALTVCCRPHSEVTALNKCGAIWEWMVFQTQNKLGECKEQRKVI